MGCVNTSSKEFKALASRHNLDSGTLEVLVHKYWLETGNETLFPTDVYVQAHMGNVQYREPGKNVRKLWDKRYSHPLVFSSMKTLSPALKNARRFFPQGAINYYKDAKGNYVLSIMRPMAKVSHDKDAFFEEYDSAGSTKNIKTLNLGITEGKTYGIDKVQQLFSTFNTDRTSKELASKVFDIAKELGLQITFDESLPNGVMGRYTNNNTIRIKKSFLERNLMNDKKASIMLHEVIHAISTYALSDQINSQEKPKALNQFKEEVTSLYDALKDNPILKGERGITNVTEFVAELANPVFREKIKNIDRENNAAKKIEKKSFWSRIVDAFKKLLGLHVTSDYYQRSMNALDKALNAFDIDTYMRYNGIKNTLRQGYNAKEWGINSLTDKELKTQVSNFFSKQQDNFKNEFINSLSSKQLKDELSIIRQESADYDITNGIEPEHKHSGKAVPQDFTFADGTTIKAPFKPNEQQAAALNVIDDFIKSDEEPTMTLSGYAGTGKTSLMEMIAKKATKDGYSVRFCASTNKAAAVLKDKVSKAGFEAFTVNKIFGIKVESNPDNKQYDAKKVVNVLKKPLVDYGEVVIIDEASMINEGNYKTLNDIAKRYALKLIYVGDEAQLAPVGETKVSKVFRNGDGKVVRLTQVERTDDNAILKEATDIRNDKPLSGESSFNSKGEGVAYVKPQNQEVINELLEKLVPKLHDNPNYFRILAYHNATVSEYNTKSRRTYGRL